MGLVWEQDKMEFGVAWERCGSGVGNVAVRE